MESIFSRSAVLRRIRNRLTGRISTEDFDLEIGNALRTMKRNQLANRDRAVSAITQMNTIKSRYSEALSEARRIERKLAKASKTGDESEIAELTLELDYHRRLAEGLFPQLQPAEDAVARIKWTIRKEEERFRVATARALAAQTLIEAEVCLEELRRLHGEARRIYPDLTKR